MSSTPDQTGLVQGRGWQNYTAPTVISSFKTHKIYSNIPANITTLHPSWWYVWKCQNILLWPLALFFPLSLLLRLNHYKNLRLPLLTGLGLKRCSAFFLPHNLFLAFFFCSAFVLLIVCLSVSSPPFVFFLIQMSCTLDFSHPDRSEWLYILWSSPMSFLIHLKRSAISGSSCQDFCPEISELKENSQQEAAAADERFYM